MEAKSASVAVVHSLKSWPEFFEQTLAGQKPFEIRKDDRGFDGGHYLSLWEWCPDKMAYTGRSIAMRVLYILGAEAGVPGLLPGYCIMGVEPIRDTRRDVLNSPAFADAQHFARSVPELQS
jgi:hypothetical protein